MEIHHRFFFNHKIVSWIFIFGSQDLQNFLPPWIKRSLYYYCLNDSYLHKELNKLEEDDATFKKCFDVAVVAEQKRKLLQEIGKGAAGLDHSGINVSRVDVSAKASNSNNQSGGSSSYNQSSSSQPYNQSGGNVQAGSSQQLYSSGRELWRPGYNQ